MVQQYFGYTDMTSVVTALLGPLAIRGFYAVQLGFHELAGHLFPALISSPSRSSEIINAKNLRANLSLNDWWQILRPGGDWLTKDPSVSLPLTGWKAKANRIGSFLISASVLPLALAGILYGQIDSNVANILTGPLSLAYVLTMIRSWQTDIKGRNSDCSDFGCGNFGIYWLEGNDADHDSLPEWVREGLLSMFDRLIVRGGQEAGIAEFVHAKKGSVAVITKVVKNRRGKDLGPKLIDKFENDLKKARGKTLGKDGKEVSDGDNLPIIRGTTGHDRFATGGRVVLEAAHPFLSSVEVVDLWRITDGVMTLNPNEVFEAMTLNSHNGDNKKFRGFKKQRTEESAEPVQNSLSIFEDELMDLNEIREFFPKLLRLKSKLPPGDSPPIALQMHFLINQASWLLSTRYAYTMLRNHSVSQATANLLTAQQEKAMAEPFKKVFARYAKALSRPHLNKKDKGLGDLYVTEEMVAQTPELQFQFDLLEKFRNALTAELWEEINKGTEVGKILGSFIKDDEMMKAYVNTTVERFFTADPYNASLEFNRRAQGSFGLVTRSNLDDTGVAIISRNQGMNIAAKLDGKQSFFAYASELTALLENFGDRGRMDFAWPMNPDGEGQVLDIRLMREGKVKIKVFSTELKRELTTEEFEEESYRLNVENPKYPKFKELVQYKNPKQIGTEDIQMTTGAVSELKESYENPDEVNARTEKAYVESWIASQVEWFMAKRSDKYGEGKEVANRILDRLFDQCANSINCSARANKVLGEEIKTVLKNAQLKSYLESDDFQKISKRKKLPAMVEKIHALGLSLGSDNLATIYALLPSKLAKGVIKDDFQQPEIPSTLKAELARTLYENPIVIRYLKERSDELVWNEINSYAKKLYEEDKPADLENFWAALDERIEDMLDEEVGKIFDMAAWDMKALLESLNEYLKTKTSTISEQAEEVSEEKGAGETFGEKIKTFFTSLYSLFGAKPSPEETEAAPQPLRFLDVGYENSLWFAEASVGILRRLMPAIKNEIKSESSNKLLNRVKAEGVTKHTRVMIRSKSGGTFPTRSLVRQLKAVTDGNIFGVTSRIDSSLSLALGEKLNSNVPYTDRVFLLGNYYAAESPTISEILMFANNIQMIIHMAEKFQKVFPKGSPWGFEINEQELTQLKLFNEELVAETQRLTGFDRDGKPVKSHHNKEILKISTYLSNYFTETPIVNLMFRAFVFGVFYLAGPIRLALNHAGFPVGPPLGSLSGAVVTGLDATISCFVPWILTTMVYRTVSKRPRWARMGPPAMSFWDLPFMHQMHKQQASKAASNAPGSMKGAFESANPRDHGAARLAHTIFRGNVGIFGIPALASAKDATLRTMRQAKGIVNGTFGPWLVGGMDVIGLGRGPLTPDGSVDPDIADRYVDIGLQTWRYKTPKLEELNDMMFDAYGRFVANKVMIDWMFRKATTINTPAINIPVPFTKKRIVFDTFTFEIWNRSWTFPRISVHTTESPVGVDEAADEMVKETSLELKQPIPPTEKDNGGSIPPMKSNLSQVNGNGTGIEPSAGSEIGADSALVAQAEKIANNTVSEDEDSVGGIDLGETADKMKVRGDAAPFLIDNRQLMNIPFEGITPEIIQIVPVPVTNLKFILGGQPVTADKQFI